MLSEAVETSDDSVYIVARNHRYVFANDAHISRLAEDGKIPRRSEDLVVGEKYGDVHPEEERTAFEERMVEVLETAETRGQTYRFRREDRWSRRTYSPVKDPESGNVENVAVVSKDVTELKQRE